MKYESLLYREKIKRLESCDIDPSIAFSIGKNYSLYNSDIRNAITMENGENSNPHFYGLPTTYQKGPSGLLENKLFIEDNPVENWLKNRLLFCSQNATNDQYPGYHTMEFRKYLSNFTISSVTDIIQLYDTICKYLYQFIAEKRSLGNDFDIVEMSKFLAFDIFLHVVNACDSFYQATSSNKKEYELSCYSITSYINDIVKNINYYTKNFDSNKLLTKRIVSSLLGFYKICKLDVSYITGNNEGIDPFTSYFINHTLKVNANSDKELDALTCEFFKNFHRVNDEKTIDYDSLFENTEDISIEDPLGRSISDISVFGNEEMVSVFSNDSSINRLKSDLMQFGQDFVKKYLNKGDNVRIDFVIDEQLKMYLQTELDSKMIVANIKKSNEVLMVTILQYENDNFVLFKVSDDPDTLYGLSLNEDESGERKLISIDKDDDMSFQFVVNFD